MANISYRLRNLLILDKYTKFIKIIESNPMCGPQLDTVIKDDTLLHLAIRNTQLEYIKALIKNGASMNIKTNQKGHDALFEAVAHCIDCCHNLWKFHVESNKVSAIQQMEQYYDIIVYLLESGADANTINHKGQTLLALICAQRHDDRVKHIIKNIVSLLIDHNIDVDIEIEYDGKSIQSNCLSNGNADVLDHIMNYKPGPITKGVY